MIFPAVPDGVESRCEDHFCLAGSVRLTHLGLLCILALLKLLELVVYPAGVSVPRYCVLRRSNSDASSSCSGARRRGESERTMRRCSCVREYQRIKCGRVRQRDRSLRWRVAIALPAHDPTVLCARSGWRLHAGRRAIGLDVYDGGRCLGRRDVQAAARSTGCQVGYHSCRVTRPAPLPRVRRGRPVRIVDRGPTTLRLHRLEFRKSLGRSNLGA